MTPAILKAWAAYRESDSPRDFWADVNQHLLHGYVLSFPQLFAMARPVRRDAEERWLACIPHPFVNPDTWLVWSAAGHLDLLLSLLPYDLPYLAFHRGSSRRRGPQPLRVYPTQRVRALAQCLHV